MPPEFRLRFPLSEIGPLADRFVFADDTRVVAIGVAAGRRGWYTRDEFLAVMLWKTPRTRILCGLNSDASVVDATRLAFSTRDERLRMSALLGLHGVAFPTASVLLHLAHRDPYPILDFRALWSLGVDAPPPFYSHRYWQAYTRECRSLAEQAGVPMRTLDRALWEYSKEQQPASATPAEVSNARERVSASGEPGNKSALMRLLYEEGGTVAEVAKALNANYSFAYGVYRRWRTSETDPSG